MKGINGKLINTLQCEGRFLVLKVESKLRGRSTEKNNEW